MATSVGLNFRLTAAVENFERSMAEVNKKLGQIERSSRQTAGGLRLLAGIEVGKLLVGGLTSVFNTLKSGLGTFTSFANVVRESIDKIGKLAESLGMNEVALQVFLKTAELSGMSADQFGSAILAMNKRLGEFYQGFGPAKKALESLGLSMEQLKKQTPAQQLRTIAQAIMTLPNTSARAAAAFAIFGDAGKKMLPTLTAIANNVDDIATKGLRLGQFLSVRQVNAIESMNDAFTEVSKTITGIGAQILANLAAPIEKALQKFQEFVASYKSFTTGTTGGTGLANDITVAFLEAAVVLGKWADFLLEGLVRFYEMMASLFSELFDFLSRSLGIDRYGSEKSNSMADEIARNEGIIASYDRLEALIGLSVDQYNKRTDLEQKNVELQKKINEEEERYYKEKKRTATGIGSIGDWLEGYKDNFLRNNGFGPQGDPMGGGGGGNMSRPPWGPPDNSGMWEWDPVNGWWHLRNKGQVGPGAGLPWGEEAPVPDTTGEDLLSSNETQTELLRRIDANTSSFELQPVVIG